MKKILTATLSLTAIGIVVVSAIQPAFGQKNDWQKENLKGRILRIDQTTYHADEKFGEIVKGTIEKKSQIWFNENGFYRRKKENDKIWEYGYAVDGRLQTEIALNEKDAEILGIRIHEYDTVSRTKYTYDSNGRLTECNIYDKDGNLTGKEKHQYLPDAHKIVSYNSSGKVEQVTLITNGGRKHYSEGGGWGMESFYDDNHRPVKESVFLLANNGTTDVIGYYKYNSHGDLISASGKVNLAIGVGVERHNVDSYYEYEYDKYGNWIVCREYERGDRRSIRMIKERDIVYAGSDEDFRVAVKAEEAEKRAISERIVRAEYRADSLRQAKQHRIDSLGSAQRSIELQLTQINKYRNYLHGIAKEIFETNGSILTLNKMYDKIKTVSVPDSTFVFEDRTTNRIGPLKFGLHYSWSSENFQFQAYIANEGKCAVINCVLRNGGPLFNQAAVLISTDSGHVYEIPAKIRKSFLGNIQQKKLQDLNMLEENYEANIHTITQLIRQEGGETSAAGRTLVEGYKDCVMVEIDVDRQGRVTSATYRSEGSTTSDTTIVNSVLRAARQVRFNADEDAPVSRVEIVPYYIRRR